MEKKEQALNDEKSKDGSPCESNGFKWNDENEVHLFYALRDHKPVGISKHFLMVVVLDMFNKLSKKNVTADVIWDHLRTLYDMEALDENEEVDFLSESVNFSLPPNFKKEE